MRVLLIIAALVMGCSAPSERVETFEDDPLCPTIDVDDGGATPDSGVDAGENVYCDIGETINALDGSCFWWICNAHHEPEFRAKPNGMPCVYRLDGNNHFTESQCQDALCGPVVF